MIDWSRVHELRDEVGAEEFRDLLEIFFEELDETTARLASAAPETIAEDDIHFLKGCALNLGFAEVSGHCRDMEAALTRRPLSAQEVRVLLASCAASKSALTAAPDLAA